MRKTGSSLLFSPTDLTKFLQNPYVTWMDRLYVGRPDGLAPDKDSADLELIFEKGLEHERRYLESLKAEGRDVCEIPDEGDEREALTLEALNEGREIIFQAALRHQNFAGYADFLVRTDRHSRLGDHSYEVWDTKLSLKAKPYFIVQLCCYADILEAIQGFRPGTIGVVLGDGTSKAFRTDDFFYYYMFLKRGFLEQQESFDPDRPPEPLAEGKNGRWESVAGEWLVEHDHLSLVAGITGLQIERLTAAGIETVKKLACAHGARVEKMRAETREKLCEQARLQVESRGLETPKYEVIPPEPEETARGLALLPPASPLDVAFDIEGYPLADGGLEYLLGATTAGFEFHDWWAHDERAEKKSFEAFIDWVYDRWRRDPSLHIYHYASYEVTAARRLMTKYATREEEVDTLLRAGVFIDLFRVVRQGLRMGIPSYSLKKVEGFYLEKREGAVATAGESILYYQKWLETRDGENWESSAILREIRDYNREDCESTWKLVDWLRAIQEKEGIAWRPPGGEEVTPEDAEREPTERELLSRRLLDSIPEDGEDRWRIRELLAWLVTFHRREDKPLWWAFFERHEMIEEELWDDLDSLAGLTRTDRPAWPIKRSTGFEYRFNPDQETKIVEGKYCYIAGYTDWKIMVDLLDRDEGRAVLKAGPKLMDAFGEAGLEGPPERLNLIPDEHVSAEMIAASVERVAASYEESSELPQALDDYLHRRRPLIGGRSGRPGRSKGAVLPEGEDVLEGTLAVVRAMKGTILCIQGPPGSGKTHTAAHVILGLLADGKRVGISAHSHKSICNLMRKAAEFAGERGAEFSAAKVGGDKDDPLFGQAGVEHVGSIREAVGDYPLIGGTAWAFSNPDAEDALDYLFVDEAGQVCIANLVGMVPSTTNIVLLGDQMQLGQPTRGAHPGESGDSTLEYLLQEHATIPGELGIFLGTTWRLHPDLCRFISEAVYEGRLQPEGTTGKRKVMVGREESGGSKRRGATPLVTRGSGLLYLPVEHTGNVQGSEEEVEQVKRLVQALRKLEHTDKNGKILGRLTADDILIVAPYNMQIRMLKQALPTGARVGTIDKFQGQEAPVVIVTMCASAGDTSPRGIEFLFNKNRLNVAISRAQSLAIVVGHPKLTQTPCGSIRQMELVNLFCRVVEEGRD